MRRVFAKCLLGFMTGLWLSSCGGSAGSCALPATSSPGYETCEDFLGTEYNSSAVQNACTVNSGTYSSNACTTAEALGTCRVGGGTADDVQFTYLPATSPSDAGAPSMTDLESACGVAGGTFTPG